MTTRVELIYEFTKAALSGVATLSDVSRADQLASTAISVGEATADLFIENYGNDIQWDNPETEDTAQDETG